MKSKIEELFEELKKIKEVESIALGGSRAGSTFDENSDYDIYLYVTNSVPEEIRRSLLSKYCDKMELGNHFWEYEDNCVLKDGIPLDILYRNLNDFAQGISDVVDLHIPHNGYTTCMWHNLIKCKILFDRNGRLVTLKEKYTRPYPIELKRNIINHNMKLLRYSMPAFEGQILKAVKRNDIVSINHRVTEFLSSYFDVIFALNEQTHPGEKRLVQHCENSCKILPYNFAQNIRGLFECMFTSPQAVQEYLNKIIAELEKLI